MQKIRQKSLVMKSEGIIDLLEGENGRKCGKSEGFFGLLEEENTGKGGGNGIRTGGNALKSPELSFPTQC